jgi:hypothetical protein
MSRGLVDVLLQAHRCETTTDDAPLANFVTRSILTSESHRDQVAPVLPDPASLADSAIPLSIRE